MPLMTHTNLEQGREGNSETCHSHFAKWFNQVQTQRGVFQRGGYPGTGLEAWVRIFQGGGILRILRQHALWVIGFQMLPIQSSKGKRNNLFFCLANIWEIYFPNFSLINYFHLHPNVSSVVSAVTDSAQVSLCRLRASLSVQSQQAHLPVGQGGWSVHAALGVQWA